MRRTQWKAVGWYRSALIYPRRVLTGCAHQRLVQKFVRGSFWCVQILERLPPRRNAEIASVRDLSIDSSVELWQALC